MKIAISQPRYLPAIIYLQRIYLSDKFVLLDDVQHSREFENRNYIKTPNGKKWLTIPCKQKSSRIFIKDLKISDKKWKEKHIKLIKQSYKKAKYFDEELLLKLYDLPNTDDFTTTVFYYLKNILNIFDFKKELILSSFLQIQTKGAQKLYDISKKLNASTYISGINGKNYIKDEFLDVKVLYHQYLHPTYQQLWDKEFFPWMGFVDMLFNVGIDEVIKSIKNDFILEE